LKNNVAHRTPRLDSLAKQLGAEQARAEKLASELGALGSRLDHERELGELAKDRLREACEAERYVACGLLKKKKKS
jgi:hypothetical protein